MFLLFLLLRTTCVCHALRHQFADLSNLLRSARNSAFRGSCCHACARVRALSNFPKLFQHAHDACREFGATTAVGGKSTPSLAVYSSSLCRCCVCGGRFL